MKVQNNVSIYMGEVSHSKQLQEMGKSKKESVAGNPFFAGNLNLPQDRVLMRQQQAQEKAAKLIKDVFNVDLRIDEGLDKRKQRIIDLKIERSANLAEIKAANDLKDELKEAYGLNDEVEPREQLTEEKFAEYQERLMELESKADDFTIKNNELNNEIIMENAIIRATLLERLKHSPMLDATEAAEDVLKAASKDILAMLYEEGKDHIDEEAEEREKQAEKIAEEKKEKKEYIGKNKEEDSDYIKEITKDVISLEKNSIDIQEEANKILSKMKLIKEDIKGIRVDQIT